MKLSLHEQGIDISSVRYAYEIAENNLLTKESVTSFFDYIYDAGAKSDTVWFIQGRRGLQNPTYKQP